jgi:F-type H+-transporting ATPase subunit epsilon
VKAFALTLHATDRMQRIDQVVAFIGVDRSGSFGICAGHVRFMTTLTIGLARFSSDAQHWRHLAMPGAVLYFDRNELQVSTRFYLMDNDPGLMSAQLAQQLAAEEEGLRATRLSLQRMEQAFMSQLLRLQQDAKL